MRTPREVGACEACGGMMHLPDDWACCVCSREVHPDCLSRCELCPAEICGACQVELESGEKVCQDCAENEALVAARRVVHSSRREDLREYLRLRQER